MNTILITGAGGNIGTEIIRGLKELGKKSGIVAAARNPGKAREELQGFPGLTYRKLDFTNPATFDDALRDIDIVFLLRPPNLADVSAYFEPFLEAMLKKKIRKIVFLSVQGAEHQKRIPHHKIEKLILAKGFEYVFLRPSYFMQNLTTTLIREIKEENRIFIPGGRLRFTWVDARDIGNVGAHILEEFESNKNQPCVITGTEVKDFYEVAALLSEKTERTIKYESPNLFRFYRHKRKQGMNRTMIFVMIMLHYLPRFSRKTNEITDTVKKLTGRTPGTLSAFIEREKQLFNVHHPVFKN